MLPKFHLSSSSFVSFCSICRRPSASRSLPYITA